MGFLENRKKCVVLIVSLCFDLENEQTTTNKNSSLACVVRAVSPTYPACIDGRLQPVAIADSYEDLTRYLNGIFSLLFE